MMTHGFTGPRVKHGVTVVWCGVTLVWCGVTLVWCDVTVVWFVIPAPEPGSKPVPVKAGIQQKNIPIHMVSQYALFVWAPHQVRGDIGVVRGDIGVVRGDIGVM